MEDLRNQYVQRLPGEIEMAEGLFNKAVGSGVELTKLHELELAAHRLSGSGATFGFPAISEAARTLEERLAEILATEVIGIEERTELADLLANLSNSVRAAVHRA